VTWLVALDCFIDLVSLLVKVLGSFPHLVSFCLDSLCLSVCGDGLIVQLLRLVGELVGLVMQACADIGGTFLLFVGWLFSIRL
jgi:hypothetical protein